MSTVFVLLPVHNRLVFTKRCLLSLKRQTYKKIVTILVDDGSTDGTETYIRKVYPQIQIIKGDGGWWWTKSMYEGVRLALSIGDKNDYVLEMNNDCVFDRDLVKQLVRTANKFPSAIIGSLCRDLGNGKDVVEAGIRIDWPTGKVYGVAQTISQDINYYKKMDVVVQLDALPGKGTLIPFRVFSMVGNFNYKRLPHYIADYEFTNRAKRYGFDLLVDTKAIVWNHWEATGNHSRENSKKTYNQALGLLFGRRSMNNIVDWVTFVFLACPGKYFWRNLWFSFCRLMVGVLSVFPFYYIKRITPHIFKIYFISLDVSRKLYLSIRSLVSQFSDFKIKEE